MLPAWALPHVVSNGRAMICSAVSVGMGRDDRSLLIHMSILVKHEHCTMTSIPVYVVYGGRSRLL
jgi:hypothetical protein